jgi:hypothetical protein
LCHSVGITKVERTRVYHLESKIHSLKEHMYHTNFCIRGHKTLNVSLVVVMWCCKRGFLFWTIQNNWLHWKLSYSMETNPSLMLRLIMLLKHLHAVFASHTYLSVFLTWVSKVIPQKYFSFDTVLGFRTRFF